MPLAAFTQCLALPQCRTCRDAGESTVQDDAERRARDAVTEGQHAFMVALAAHDRRPPDRLTTAMKPCRRRRKYAAMLQ